MKHDDAKVVLMSDIAVDLWGQTFPTKIHSAIVGVVGDDDPRDPAVCVRLIDPKHSVLAEYHINGKDAEAIADAIKAEVARQRALARPN